jgi:hypothetical protein
MAMNISNQSFEVELEALKLSLDLEESGAVWDISEASN